MKAMARPTKYGRPARVVAVEPGKKWRAESYSRRNEWHFVQRSRRGLWSCLCGRWIFQRGPADEREACHHIDQVQAWCRAQRVLARAA